MRPYDWLFVAAGVSGLTAVAAILSGRSALAWASGVSALASAVGVTVWSRRHPSPMPFAFRGILRLSSLGIRFLKPLLAPKAGERMLEIGPGVGHQAVAIAAALAPGGELEVLDVQQPMLDAVMERVRRAGLDNVFARQADATSLPHAGYTFDAAYMSAVLGEIPDRDSALRELHRVLKPTGRVVIAEILIDPDYISLKRLKIEAARAGFVFDRSIGTPFAYAARFRRSHAPIE